MKYLSEASTAPRFARSKATNEYALRANNSQPINSVKKLEDITTADRPVNSVRIRA